MSQTKHIRTSAMSEEVKLSKKRSLDDDDHDKDDNGCKALTKKLKPATTENQDATQILTIDVGGIIFKMARSTILSEDWVLSKSMQHNWKRDQDVPFYDADPTIFNAILFALRTQTPFQPPKNIPVEAITQQLMFWGLKWWEARSLLFKTGSFYGMDQYIYDRLRQYLTVECLDSKEKSLEMPSFVVIEDNLHPAHALVYEGKAPSVGTACVDWPDDVYPSDEWTIEKWITKSNWCTDDDRYIDALMRENKCTTLDALSKTAVAQEELVKSRIEMIQQYFKIWKASNKHIQSYYANIRYDLVSARFQTRFFSVLKSYGIQCTVVPDIIRDIRYAYGTSKILLPGWMFPTQPDFGSDSNSLVLMFGDQWMKHAAKDCVNVKVTRFQFSPLQSV